MDSPLARPRVDHAQLSEDDDSDIAGPLLFQWAHSISPLYRALLVLILSSVFSVLMFSSLPLWRPFGVLMLHKLWDILRFVVLTTSIGLGIANINLWRGNDKDRDAIVNASSDGKEESVSSKAPFVSMFYSELQASYSFSDKEMEVGEYGVTRSESGIGKGDDATMSVTTADVDDRGFQYAHIDKLANHIISHTAHSSKASVARDVQSVTKREEPSVDDTMKVAPTKPGKSRLVKASTDDIRLGTVDHGNELAGETARHRRGNSLEFPIEQEDHARHRLADIGPAARDQRPGDVQDTIGNRRPSSARKAPSLVPKIITSDHTKGKSDASSSSKSNNIQFLPASSSTSTSKHNRSRSAYDLNDLLVYERRPARSKPATTSQLARRRNVSLSCDLDKDYSTVGGIPAWLASLPPPPVPPLIDGYTGGAHMEIFTSGERVTEKQQDESSLRKAYTESLAPWRVATNAVPVNIPRKDATDDSQKHPRRGEKKKAPLMKDQNTILLSPPSSPSTPNSFMGSPSPGELKKKVDDFISRFHERMRLQRLESLERRRQDGPH